MENYIKKLGRNSLFVSVLLLILSIFLIIKPVASLNLIVQIFAGILSIDGIVHIISYFRVSSEFRMFSFELVEGILQILIGLITLFKPSWISAFFPVLIGLWILLSSIIKFQLALNLRYVEGSNWVMLMILSVITFILGLIIVFNPIASTFAITTLCGAMLFASEFINIIEYIFILVKLK